MLALTCLDWDGENLLVDCPMFYFPQLRECGKIRAHSKNNQQDETQNHGRHCRLVEKLGQGFTGRGVSLVLNAEQLVLDHKTLAEL